jgi:hypothetical protein
MCAVLKPWLNKPLKYSIAHYDVNARCLEIRVLVFPHHCGWLSVKHFTYVTSRLPSASSSEGLDGPEREPSRWHVGTGFYYTYSNSTVPMHKGNGLPNCLKYGIYQLVSIDIFLGRELSIASDWFSYVYDDRQCPVAKAFL